MIAFQAGGTLASNVPPFFLFSKSPRVVPSVCVLPGPSGGLYGMEGAGPPRPRAWRPHTGCPREGLPVTRQALAEGPRALGAGFVLGRRRDRHGELLPQVRTCARLCTRVHACVCAHTRSQSFGEPEAERAGKGRQD